ncbi:MAG: hypothetical protein ACRD35_04660 [Candidatus Acidiferrales bacterium]
MNRSTMVKATALMLTLVVAQFPVWGMNTALGKVVPRTGTALVNGGAVQLETTVFSGDTVATRLDGLAVVLLPQGDQVHLGPNSAATLTGNGQELLVALERGMTMARSGNGQVVSVNAHGIMVRPNGPASYEVAIDGNALLVAARHGDLAVVAANGSFPVPSGKVMKFELTTETSATTPAGRGASHMSPGVAVIFASLIGGGAALTTYLINQDDINNLQDDLAAAQDDLAAVQDQFQEVCDALAAVSPAVPLPSGC